MDLQVTEGCCGTSLRKSTIVIGWFHAVVSTLLAVILFAFGSLMFDNSEELRKTLLLLTILYGLLEASLVTEAITSSLLLYGIYKKKHQFMLPHVITSPIALCLQAFSILIMDLFFEANFVDFLKTIVGTVVGIFVWRTVYSYYIELKEESTGQSQMASPAGNSHSVEKTLNNV